jgi:hypothetical protein
MDSGKRTGAENNGQGIVDSGQGAENRRNSEFRDKMKSDIRKFFLGHLKGICRFGKKNIPAPFIMSHILYFTQLEIFQLGYAETLHPACLI